MTTFIAVINAPLASTSCASPQYAAALSAARHPMTTSEYVRARRSGSRCCCLWLAGNALRLTILAVPPVIPLIHDDLHMSADAGRHPHRPAVAAVRARRGAGLAADRAHRRAGGADRSGLLLTAVGGALRGAVNDVLWLYAMTIVMGAGVAIMQVAMPPAVRAWVPQQRIGICHRGLHQRPADRRDTAGRADDPAGVAARRHMAMGLCVLERAGRGHRRAGAAVCAARHDRDRRQRSRRWWPDWNDPLIWRLGIMLGTVNAMYFGTNAFMPDFLTRHGQGEWISAALTALNLGQLPGSFILLAFASRLQLRVWPFVAAGVLCLIGTAGDCVRHRLLDGRWRGFDRLCRRFHTDPGAGAAAAVERAERRAPADSGDVHDQLYLRGDRARHQRRGMGPDRHPGDGVRPDRGMLHCADRAFARDRTRASLTESGDARRSDRRKRHLHAEGRGRPTSPASSRTSTLPPVYATPMMIRAMENAALNAVRDYLEPGESAVGTAVDIKHLAATPVGHQVTATRDGHQGRRPPHLVRRQRARRDRGYRHRHA